MSNILRVLGDATALGVVIVAGVLCVAAFAILLGPRPYRVVQRRVRCPVHGREADVAFLLESNGGETYREVVECSLRPEGEPLACAQVCRSLSVAPFGA
jgi:hypothetical protein